MEPFRPDDALAEGVRRCAIHGGAWFVLNSDAEIVWEIEANSREDDDDLTFPVIVLMREGTLASDSIALLSSAVKG